MFLEHYTGVGFCLLDRAGGTVLYRNVGAENIVALADVTRDAAEDAMRAARRCTRLERAEDLNEGVLNDEVRLLTEPRLDDDGRWTALANAYGMLAIVELKVSRAGHQEPADHG